MNREQFLEKIMSYEINVDLALISKAIGVIIKYHDSQMRASGEPYYYHPLEVADILAKMHLDTDTIVAAILHDTIEDTTLKLKDIKEMFGLNIAKMVDGLTKLDKIQFNQHNIMQAENFRKLLLAMSDDIRILLIKLADRLHNMRTIEYLPAAKRSNISLETLEIYAPLAERVGVQQIKTELQDLAFGVLYPEVKKTLETKFNSILSNAELLITQIIDEINKTIRANSDISFNIYGRKKTIYSAWMKMQQKNISVEQLSDIIAFRIIVENEIDCYHILGIVHKFYKMIPGTFQDFISTPKNNGYRSLHTLVIGPFLHQIEIQIRTQKMHEIAELGIAAHWKYKQNYCDVGEANKYNWIRELLKILEHNHTPEDFLRHTKMAMYYNQVFCFTSSGNLIALPKNATIIDFAYTLGAEIGNKCLHAKVNNVEVPVTTKLVNGNVVEIVTGDELAVRPEWEHFAITGQAKSQIREVLNRKNKSQFIKIGDELFSEILLKFKLKFKNKILKKICTIFNMSTDEFLYEFGSGNINEEEVIKNILVTENYLDLLNHDFSYNTRIAGNFSETSPQFEGISDNIKTEYAKCCTPMVGEQIIGIYVGTMVLVHTTDCAILKQLEVSTERFVELKWNKNAFFSIPLISKIRILIVNKINSLSRLFATILYNKCNVINFKMVNRNSAFFEIILDLEIPEENILDNLIEQFEQQEEIRFVAKV